MEPPEQSVPDPAQTALGSPLNRLLLEDAWRLFCIYDRTAIATQRRFLRFRTSILILVVMATALAILKSVFWGDSIQVTNITQIFTSWGGFFYGLVIIAPILVSILLVASVKFDRGMNWILLRASAEIVKKEIYCYRAISALEPQDSDMRLAEAIQVVTDRLMKTQVNRSGLAFSKDLEVGSEHLTKAVKQSVCQDDEHPFAALDAQQYIDHRLIDQLSWYRRKAVKLDQQWQVFQWSIYVFGGLGTFLAATRAEIWIAITNAIASALTSFLDFKQLDTTLVSYNQAASNLENLLCWWHALTDTARQDKQNIKKLVLNTEKVIQTATTSWVQEMRDALSELYTQDQKDVPPEEQETTADKLDRAV